MTEREKSGLFALLLVIIIFGVPYLWRRYRDNDIKVNSKYAFAKIVKKTGSLKNGNHWHYGFYYRDTLISGSWSTHADYNVNMGDYFIVNFSSKDPEHNKILYDYKLKKIQSEIVKKVWDTIPKSLTMSGRK